MTSYELALFLHLFFVILAFALSGIGHMNMFEMRKATTVAQMRPIASRLKSVEPLFPISALALFGAGAYMVHRAWNWSDPWVVTSIVGLVIMELIGGVYLGGATRRMNAAIAEADLTGPIPAAVDKIRYSPGVWLGAHLGSGIAVGIVFLMTVKPGLAGSVLGVGSFAIVGMLTALPFAGPVTSPTTTTSKATA